ncbi:MAG: lipid A deacylase LpxR family protein [Pseudomonadota bacterium]
MSSCVRYAAMALFLCLIGVPSSAAADDTAPVYGFLFENDWAGGRDENYSAGWQFTRAVKRDNSAARDRYLQLGVGQQIYTPQKQFVAEPLPNQHPYAGWLFGEAIFVTDRGRSKPIDTVGVQIGVVGPWAGGEEVQDFAHRLVDESPFDGWDNQIGNQPGLQIHLQRRWTSMSWGEGLWRADFQPMIAANLGNVLVSAEAGGTFRFGQHMGRPLGEHRHQPGSSGLAWFPDQPSQQKAAFAYMSAQARAVGYAIWLDGRPFQDDIVTQASEDFVYEFEGGLSLPLPLGNSRVVMSFLRRSRTFRTQADPQGIGRLSLVTRF